MDTTLINRAFAGRYRAERTISFLGGRIVRAIGLPLHSLILLPAFIFPVVLPASPYQQQEREAKNPKSELTDEEKEIINDREMLEILPLLQNFDRIEFIDLLNEMEPDWSEKEDPDKSEGKNEEGKMP